MIAIDAVFVMLLLAQVIATSCQNIRSHLILSSHLLASASTMHLRWPLSFAVHWHHLNSNSHRFSFYPSTSSSTLAPPLWLPLHQTCWSSERQSWNPLFNLFSHPASDSSANPIGSPFTDTQNLIASYHPRDSMPFETLSSPVVISAAFW